MTIDSFLDRVPGPKYNCLDFSREVWLALTGEDITDRLSRLVGDFSQRRATASGFKSFTRLLEPSNPCLVVMQRFRFVPHIGIYLDRRVLHMHSKGVEFQPLFVARAYFQKIRYYR